MKAIPTKEESAAAATWLAEWCPGYSVGQWAALAELLAERRAATEREDAA